MFKTIQANLVLPLAVRVGSLSAGALVGWGLNAEHSNWIGTGIAGALLIGVDLIASWARRWSIVSSTLDTNYDRSA